MEHLSVADLARMVGVPVERLLEQIKEAGLPQIISSDRITNRQRSRLLAYLKSRHGDNTGGESAPVIIETARKPKSSGSLRRPKGLVASQSSTTQASANSAVAISPKEFTQKYGIRWLYHFTDTRNLPSIRAHGGLLPWSDAHDKALAPGGNDWSHEADAFKGQDRFVHLCFLPEHPMEYLARQDGRIQKSQFLRIDSRIIDTPGVKFCSATGNKAGVPMLDLAEAIDQMDFEIIALLHSGARLTPSMIKRKRVAEKYELLVPTKIPLDLITGI